MSEDLFQISLLTILLLFFMFYIMIRLRKGRKLLEKKENSGVGFVVETFHELVSKLKDKERELEILRKKAEERADVIESHNEYILQSVPSGVISFDSTLNITKVNSAAEKILGFDGGAVEGKSYREVFSEPLRSILEGNLVLEREEIQYIVSPGNNIYLGLSLAPLLNADMEPIGQLLVFTDITEIKALESQIELRNRLLCLGEMAAGMAHELRNPMGVVAGYTKLLSKKADPSLLHIVDSISQEVAVMDRVITDFLSFAKPAELNISSVDLDGLIRDCLANVVTDSGINIDLMADGISPVQGDRILLRQAFTNLIQNAIEAMQQGGKLKIGFSSDANLVEISVSDTGYEIPEAIRDKIFLPFYTTKDRGTGLGLAVVHKIIMAHHGSISVESASGGSVFRIRLPLKQKLLINAGKPDE